MNHRSGLLSLSDKVRAAGRGRDTVLAHITPEEATLLKERGGRGSTNPVTGLLEFEDDYYSSPISMDYSAPSYSYSLPDLYTPPSNDYYSQNYGGYLPIDYGSNAILNNANQSSYATINDIYNNNINNLSNGINNYSPTVNTPIDYSYLNPVAPPTTVTDYYDPGYNYGNVAPIQTPVTTPTQPDYTTTPVTPVEQPTYEQPQIQYNDPTASYRYDILGNLSPDAFYRSQFAPEFANEIYSNVNPNFSVDEQGNPDVATGTTTDGINTAPLAGDFVDAQGNLTTEGLSPEVTPTVESNLADLPSENANEAAARLEAMSPETKRAFAARLAMEAAKENAPGSLKGLIDESADAAGTDPRKMYGIVAGESGHKDTYDTNITSREESYGPFQLNRKGGLGATFEKETGLDLADPATIPAQTRWVAEYLAQHPNMNVGKTWYGYNGDKDWSDKWGNAGLTPPIPPMPTARPTDEQLAMYNPGSEYSAPLPPGRPTAEEFAAYGAPPALPPMITGVGNSAYNLPRGIMSYAEQPTPPANIPTQTGETPDANAVTSPSLMDRAIKAAPGAAVDFGLSSLIPFYGPASLAAKVLGIETPGSMLGSNLTGGFANYPKSATATEYVPPVEAPAEIGKLPQTAGGTPIISEPATGPIQYPNLQYSSPPGSPSNEVLTGQGEETAPAAQDVIDENYRLPPGTVGSEPPPGLSRNPDLPPVTRSPIPTASAMPLSSSGGYASSGGGTPSFGGGGGGGGPSVSVGGGGGGGSRAAAAPTGGGSLGAVSASNFGFQGIGGINRDYRSPVVENGRTVDFGTPSRQLAYDLNLPAIQQAAMNPNSYRNYLSQYKQLFG